MAALGMNEGYEQQLGKLDELLSQRSAQQEAS